jgi:chitooligosaccharide deacetylase
VFLAFFAVAAGLVALAHTAPFPFVLDWSGPGRPLWRMPATEPPTVYLTFDDGPNPEATPALLDVLARERAPATFFLIERHVTAETASIVRRIAVEGHAIGLHSHTRALTIMPPGQLAAALEAFADRIEFISGARPCRAFRPHAGWRSGSMLEALDRIDYRLVGWGWRLWDWNWYRRPSAASTVARVLAHVSPGDIVVLHDGHHKDPRSDRRHTVDTAAALVPALRARGFALGRICEAGG